MVRPGLQVLLLVVLITAMSIWHQLAKLIVHQGFGLIALAIIFLSLPKLSDYLD